ncbi:MAG TPA: DUF5670 family protein [Candidatus Acidoferrales bacterium]|nr:DUF5670 family protein [Candidatus Acidoferrales bacterium]
MLWTLSIIFLNLWLVGITTASTFHGYLHILLLLAGLALLTRFLPRRRTVD